MSNRQLPALFIGLGPGLLVAATGVGAGDLATAAFTGSHLGPAVLWAVVVGAALKFVLTEALARWQLATGQTLLEGAVFHFGRAVQAIFLVYLVFWSFFVGSALISACGVTAHALWPIFQPETGKIVFGLVHSAAALVLVQLGGYRLFENLTRGGSRPSDGLARTAVDSSSWPYRTYLYALAIIPAAGLWGSFEQVQKVYAIVGAAFMPLLAVVLLILNGLQDPTCDKAIDGRRSPLLQRLDFRGRSRGDPSARVVLESVWYQNPCDASFPFRYFGERSNENTTVDRIDDW